MRTSHRRRFRLEHFIVTLLVAVLAILLVLSGASSFLSQFLYDRMLYELPAPQETDVVIVAIDEHSLRKVGRWPWDRGVHADVINRLAEQNTKAVFFDVILAEPDLLHPESDDRLAQAIASHGQVYLPIHVEQLRAGGQLLEVLPLQLFADAAHRLGHVDLDISADGVVRQVYLRSGISQPWWPHIALAMADDFAPKRAQPYQEIAPARTGSFANVRQYPRLIPFAGQPGSYPQLSIVDVIEGRVPQQLLRNKVVMIGATAAGLGDTLATPMSRGGELMSGVEINANILDALLQERLITPLELATVILLSALLAMLAPLLLPFVAPRWAVLLVISLVGLQLLFGYALMRWGHLWLPLGPLLLATTLAYPLWTWRRLAYTLDYLKATLRRLSEYGDLNQRLSKTPSLNPMFRMIEQLLPTESWRLENLDSNAIRNGGKPVAIEAWQSSRVRHYTFEREGQRYELSVLWQDESPDADFDAWTKAMIRRATAAPPLTHGGYEVVENYIQQAQEEEARQQALMRFFDVSFEHLQDGVVIGDACGDILLANKRALRWLSCSAEEMKGSHFLDVTSALELPAEHGDWNALVSTAITRGGVQFECKSLAGDDLYLDLVRVDAGAQPGQVLVLTLKEISDVKQAMRSRSEMLDFLSHDLRSPMVSVIALCEQKRYKETTPELEQFLNSIEYHAERNLRIAEQFLQLARVESLEEVEMLALDMLPVVENAMDDVRAQAQKKEIALRFKYQDDEDVWVKGNYELLQRLLVNLLTNAIKYSDGGTTVEIRLTATGEQVICEVQDQGAGIPEAFIEHLFEPFSRAKGSENNRGAGLGLRFVKVVSERHSGDISVTSQPGEGSCFTLSLPRESLDDIEF